MERVYDHPGIGRIVIKKRISSRNIRLTVHPEKGINISIPWLTRYSVAERFVEEKKEWILESLIRQKSKAEKRKFLFGPGHPLKIITGEIVFEEKESGTSATNKKISIKRGPSVKIIAYPGNTPAESIIDAVIALLRKEAKDYLPTRAEYLAKMHGFHFNRIFLKNNRSNWGSCSRQNNINLNVHLMRLDSNLADFVIIHELCHLKHKNHGREFHNLVNKLCNGQEKEFNRLLRKERPVLEHICHSN